MKTTKIREIVFLTISSISLLFALISNTMAAPELSHPTFTWSLSPSSTDWNTAANWMPQGVPDEQGERAAFGPSAVTTVNANNTVHSVEFAVGANQYSITGHLTFSGGGVINGSGVNQTFTGTFRFQQGATAESLVTFNTTNITFSSASAGSATYINNGGLIYFSGFPRLPFPTSADTGTFINDGEVRFHKADAGSATFINNGGVTFGADGGVIKFTKNSRAVSSTIINNGGAVFGGKGAQLIFGRLAHAGSATLVANGGAGPGSGATILFMSSSTGDSARVEVFGNGSLDVSRPLPIDDTVGSIEGNGLVFLGSSNLSVGSNNLNTTFAGVISESGGVTEGTGGSLTKTGTGTLILSNTNAYSGGTIINGGALLIANTSGSGTGTGTVEAVSGTVGGTGTIAGEVMVGTGSGSGAILSPGTAAGSLATLTIQSGLTFNSDGICQVELNSTTSDSDDIVANGVTINGTAQFSVTDLGSSTLPVGTVFTVFDNTSANPISGTFSNLADGSTVNVGSNAFQANYEGGDGNDFTLTVVP